MLALKIICWEKSSFNPLKMHVKLKKSIRLQQINRLWMTAVGYVENTESCICSLEIVDSLNLYIKITSLQ